MGVVSVTNSYCVIVPMLQNDIIYILANGVINPCKVRAVIFCYENLNSFIKVLAANFYFLKHYSFQANIHHLALAKVDVSLTIHRRTLFDTSVFQLINSNDDEFLMKAC